MDYLPVMVAAVMIWAVIDLLTALTYIGYDARSRGVRSKGLAMMTLHMNDIAITDYFRRKDIHPADENDTDDIASAKRYKILALLFFVILIVLTVATVAYASL